MSQLSQTGQYAALESRAARAADGAFDEDTVAVLCMLLAFAAVLVAVAFLWIRRASGGGAPRVASARNSVSRRQTNPPPAARRVITLYHRTPGQGPHEYNLGDDCGSRGHALVTAPTRH